MNYTRDWTYMSSREVLDGSDRLINFIIIGTKEESLSLWIRHQKTNKQTKKR